MTPAELATLAWRGPFAPCSTCAQTRNHRCLTRTGNRTSPHKPRLDMATGWDARQDEVDTLTGTVTNLAAVVDQTEAALRLMTTQRDDLRISLRAAYTKITGLTEQAATLTRDLEATRAEWDAHMRNYQHPRLFAAITAP